MVKDRGFTLVETMFVLAIMGLILLILVTAIPPLQRNSRNSNRRQEAAQVLQAVSRYELNHGGNFPTCSSSTTDCGTVLSIGADFQVYRTSNITVTPQSPLGPAYDTGTPPADLTDSNLGGQATVAKLAIYNHYTCDGVSKAVSTSAGYHDAVALYLIEVRGGTALACKPL